MVSLLASRNRAFGEAQERLLTAVAAQVSATLDRLETVEEAERSHLESVVDAMGEGLLWVDGEGRVRLANPAARRFLEDLAGEPHPGRLERLGNVHLSTLKESLGEGAIPAARPEIEIVASGRRISLTVSAMRGRGGIPDGLVILLADVTEQQLLREKLQRSERLSALGEMISGVAHELNNPLTVVMGQTQLLDSGVPDGSQGRERTRSIHREALRCRRIVQNLLSFARSPGRDREPVDLNGCVRAVTQLLEHPLRVDQVAARLDLSPDLPAVMGDAHDLQQVLLNLVTNAHHALQGVSRSRRIQISSRAREDRVVLVVEDNGMGIPAEHLGRVFEPFPRRPGEERGLA
jgi:two-component system NtrC family sensor kinase